MTPVEMAIARLRDRILAAAAERSTLRIVGGDSKRFLGRAPVGEPLLDARPTLPRDVRRRDSQLLFCA